MSCPQFRGLGAQAPSDAAARVAVGNSVHPGSDAQIRRGRWTGSSAAFGLDWLSAGQMAWLALLPDGQEPAGPLRQARQRVLLRVSVSPLESQACAQGHLRRHGPLQGMDAIAGQGGVPCR